MFTSINRVIKTYQSSLGKEFFLQSWVKTFRETRKIIFIEINDGTCVENIQVVVLKNENSSSVREDSINKVKFAAFLKIKGVLQKDSKEEKVEVKFLELISLDNPLVDFPLPKKSLSLDFLRSNLFVRQRTRYFNIIFRLRSLLSLEINKFFQERDFIAVTTPLITSSDAEGAGELFEIARSEKNGKKIDFFDKKAKMIVSGQLHLESLTQGLTKVYNFSPCFRAESSNTTRHLAEFWMIEAEMITNELGDLIKICQNLIKHLIEKTLLLFREDFYFLEEFTGKKIIIYLEKFLKKDFEVITYQEALRIIRENFSTTVTNGEEINSEHEKLICAFFSSPVFVTKYPCEIKAFYMKKDESNNYVECFDLLVPGLGELIGGSLRENEIFKLKKEIEKRSMDEGDLK